MKFFYPLLIALFLSATILAQVPQAFNYQAAVRDNAGNVLINQSVSFRMSILQGSTSGLPVFVETHDTVTNQAGLVNLDIGDGNVEYGDFSGIKWQSGLYFLQTEIDTDGGINFQITGTTQLLSVPYSMYSGLSEGLELTDNNGKKYQLAVDTYGNLITTTQPDLACGQILVDPRDGQKYATVKIGTQCWMAQNLNTGVRISGVNNQSDDGIIQKYCYSNDTVYCDTYGGLYQWDEMMDYSTTPGTMGICPPTGGWHIPTDGDWCILEAYVDSTIICDDTGLRGTDGGNKLKEAGTLHWFWPNLGASNSSGFTALPGGIRSSGSGSFLYFQYQGYFWTSNKYTTNAWHRILYTGEQKVGKYAGNTKNGHSVRCVRGINSPPTSPSNPNPHDWAFNTPVNTSLSWSCTDPENDPITYNIYFGTDSLPPLVMSNKHDPDFTPGPLNFATYYFWKVCAQDDNGNLTEGPLWTFATAGDPWNCGDPITDSRDGKTYNTVRIGWQCWMAENLNVGVRISVNTNMSNDGIIEKYCYDDSQINCSKYGGLYQWDEMMNYNTNPGTQGICPPSGGWHTPADLDWCEMEQWLDGSVDCNALGPLCAECGGELKMRGIYYWDPPNTGATNSVGFSAFAGGYWDSGSVYFIDLGLYGHFYTSTELDGTYAIIRSLENSSADLFRLNSPKLNGFSVRCMKD